MGSAAPAETPSMATLPVPLIEIEMKGVRVRLSGNVTASTVMCKHRQAHTVDGLCAHGEQFAGTIDWMAGELLPWAHKPAPVAAKARADAG